MFGKNCMILDFCAVSVAVRDCEESMDERSSHNVDAVTYHSGRVGFAVSFQEVSTKM